MNKFTKTLIKLLRNKKIFILIEVICYIIAMKGVIELIISYVKNDMFDLGAIIIVIFLLSAIHYVFWLAFKIFKMKGNNEE